MGNFSLLGPNVAVRRRAGRELHVTGDGLAAGADVQFFVNFSNVGVDGGEADAEIFGNFFVKVAPGKEFEDFPLARRQGFGIGVGNGRALK
jgi:hypothetical protein